MFKKLIVSISMISCMLLFTACANNTAASSSTPAPTVTAAPTVTPTATPTAKATVKATAKATSKPTAKATTATKTWKTVTTFKGSSTKTTAKFTVTSNEWRIRWTTAPVSADMSFSVVLFDKDGEIITVVANVIGKGSDESYVYQSGVYYLQIITGAQNYDITVEQKQ